VSDPVRVVVAEGPSTRKGLLRFVLEGEGYDVVSDAATSAELARVVAVHRPHVVVMDDGIGAMAVAMIRTIAPSTRVVLVWPGAVVPIGGDARVEPSDVLRELGRTMERLTGQPSTTSAGAALHGAGTSARPRQDPAALRAILARGEAAQLQRRPSPAGQVTVGPGEAIIGDRAPASVVLLPLTASVDPAAETGAPRRAGIDEIVIVPEADPPEGPDRAADLGRATPRSAADLETSEPDRHAHKR
jgi:CheY-like chemotaxis protein